MKKLISMLLAITLVLTLTFVMTACGDTDTQSTDISASDTEQTETPSESDVDIDPTSTFPEALQNVEANQISDMSLTGWEFSGGLIDGAEMTQEDANTILDASGGKFQMIFVDDKNVQIITGNGDFNGTYAYMNDNYVVKTDFTEYAYYGVLTTVEENLVLILSKTDTPDTAIYMRQIDEY